MKIGNKQLKNKYIALIAVIIVLVAGALWSLPYLTSATAETAMVYVPTGATNDQLRDSLESSLGKPFGTKVAQVLQWRGVDADRCSGAYRIEQGTNIINTARTIMHRRQTPIKVTFNNKRTLKDWSETVSAKLMMSSDELLAAVTNEEKCAELGFTPETVPAMLFPDTYEFYWTVTPDELLAKFKTYYDKFWTGDRLAKAKALGITPIEVTTVASITEEESAKRDERGRIGRLYINRFMRSMPLQADPTVKFAIGDFKIQRITGAMLKTDSPYNTYRYAGFPPGPIRLTEQKTIDAVLNSEPSSDLFMCAKADFSGYHHFSSTFAEHVKYAQEYHKALNALNIH